MNEFDGFWKLKGDLRTLAPQRFIPIEVNYIQPYMLIQTQMIGYAIYNGIYWVISRIGEGKYCRVPFAKSQKWFQALTSELEYKCIGELPQIYITGIA